MESREAAIEALKKGKVLVSSVTQLQYTLIGGKLYSRHTERHEWNLSGLTFENPASWLNLRE